MHIGIAGPLCQDEIIIHGKTSKQPGGVTYYSGAALDALGCKVTIYGTCKNLPEGLSNLKIEKMNLSGLKPGVSCDHAL
ncbi:MAG: hypothetical protein ABIA93_06235 [Candidatus Woesearchaeota archaeon]